MKSETFKGMLRIITTIGGILSLFTLFGLSLIWLDDVKAQKVARRHCGGDHFARYELRHTEAYVKKTGERVVDIEIKREYYRVIVCSKIKGDSV
jgi:hypothetical protein